MYGGLGSAGAGGNAEGEGFNHGIALCGLGSEGSTGVEGVVGSSIWIASFCSFGSWILLSLISSDFDSISSLSRAVFKSLLLLLLLNCLF